MHKTEAGLFHHGCQVGADAKACRKGLRMNFFWCLALACEALQDLAKDGAWLAGHKLSTGANRGNGGAGYGEMGTTANSPTGSLVGWAATQDCETVRWADFQKATVRN